MASGIRPLASATSKPGVRWIDYRRTLRPRYGIVWRDISVCYVLIVAALVAMTLTDHASDWDRAGIALVGGVWIGYWLHSLFLFGHEAAHFNLAPTRRANNLLGDWLVWIFFGSTTEEYRRFHLPHHAHLGEREDTEISYRRCLSLATIGKAAGGIYVVELLTQRVKLGDRLPTDKRRAAWASLRTLMLHVAIVTALVITGWYAAAAGWVVGVGAVFPVCATLRQIAEHRELDAGCDVNFAVVQDAATNRIFGTGLFSRTFGAAGFNRHLLHHWDPSISYTRFDDMANFLADTPLAATIEASRTTYGAAFRRMLTAARAA